MYVDEGRRIRRIEDIVWYLFGGKIQRVGLDGREVLA